MPSEQDYHEERMLFWSDLIMGCVIIGAAACGFLYGVWAAVATLLGEYAG